ncbi:uncharacterized protein HKW66_Vig0036670 [Vigna angularis]|uniref:Uncharacterized protein n=1 Tax=Phaseolus angularis TaxID=3914 RepID=A0A8T0LFP8_PHAAN|nr:uncharacterized protein HKW66_Vig0036670 [Vigna angularis]
MLSHSTDIAFDRVEEGLNSGSGFGREKAKMKTSAGSVEETKNTLVDEEDECAKVENEDRFQLMRIRIPDEYLVGLHPVTHPIFVPYMSTILVRRWQCLAWRIVGECRRCSSHATKKLVAERSVDLNQNMDYIPEEPNYHEYRDPTPPSPPPSVDEYSPGQTQSVSSGGTSSS